MSLTRSGNLREVHRFIVMLQGNPFLAEAARRIHETGGACVAVASAARCEILKRTNLFSDLTTDLILENQKIVMASAGTFAALQLLLAVSGFGLLGPVAGTSPFSITKAPSPRNIVQALLTPSRYPRPRMTVGYVWSLHARRRSFRHAAVNGDDRATCTC